MSAITRIFPDLLSPLKRIGFSTKISQPVNNFHSLTNEGSSQINPGGLFNVFTRTIIRIHFPRPSEKKRIKRHGWRARMSTPEGRRIIMNRILKGRHVYTH